MLGLRAEKSDDSREGYGTKTGVGTGGGFDTEITEKLKGNDIDTRFGNGTNLRLQTVCHRECIGRLGMREKSNDDLEGYGSRTGVGTGVGFGRETNRKNSMETHKETREGFGTGAGISAMVGVGIDKGMNSGSALLFDGKGTGTTPDAGTLVGTDLDTSGNSVSATNCHSGKGTGRKLEVMVRDWITAALGKLHCRFRSNR